MNEISTNQTTITRSGALGSGEHLLTGLKSNTASAFSALYDQYASMLLGVIMKIVRDEHEAIPLLEVTFIKIRSQFNEFQPAKQPLFTWLLAIARHTALDALKARKAVKQSTFQLTTSGKVVVSELDQNTTPFRMNAPVRSADFQLKELLDTVLFKNCTPEEAAGSLGIPVELARQKLRLAMQQLRTPKTFD